MVKSVVREHHWTPDIIGRLFFDRLDYKGLLYWYDDVKEMDKEMKADIERNKLKNKIK
jgi:hypothetical protein